jgi:KUP system potassium uptake protein
VFGPIMMVWFATLALLGLPHRSTAPSIIGSINPIHIDPVLRPISR